MKEHKNNKYLVLEVKKELFRVLEFSFYKENINVVSQPLDGQQRLTTLFLLHWYAAVKSQLLNSKNIDILKKFSYETRISSREFCNTLVSNPVHLTKTIDLRSEIVDSAWFFLSW